MSIAIYAHEKFHNAVEALALNDGLLRDRLYAAYTAFHTLTAAELPTPEMNRLFRELMGRMTAVQDPDGVEGHVKKSLRAAGELELRDMAQMVLDLHERAAEAARSSRKI